MYSGKSCSMAKYNRYCLVNKAPFLAPWFSDVFLNCSPLQLEGPHIPSNLPLVTFPFKMDRTFSWDMWFDLPSAFIRAQNQITWLSADWKVSIQERWVLWIFYKKSTQLGLSNLLRGITGLDDGGSERMLVLEKTADSSGNLHTAPWKLCLTFLYG